MKGFKDISLVLLFLLTICASCETQNNIIETKDDITDPTPFALNDTEDETPIENPRVRFILLKTSDVTITPDMIIRLQDIGDYTEDYYVTQLTQQGYNLPNKKMFARNRAKDVLIYTVESSLSSLELNDIKDTGVKLAKAKYSDLNDRNTIWAIIHFKDKGGFTGEGNVVSGRMKFQYKMTSGSIDFSKHMSETEFHRDISLKAILHELGHAFTLLHNGPLQNNIKYNMLMGPVNNTYETKVGIDQTADVVLSDYSAAMIANHPIFKDAPFNTTQLTNKTLQIDRISTDIDLFSIDPTTGNARVRGKVTSDLQFHHIAILFNYSKAGYWDKAFAVVPDDNGIFNLPLTPNDINIGDINEYKVFVCFNNGLNLGVQQLEVAESLNISSNPYRHSYTFK